MNARLLLASASLLAACGTEPERPPLPAPQPTTTIGNGDPVAAPKPPRTVSVRNPFGDVSFPQNLMVDGDFELTGRAGQMPWIAAGSQGQQIALEYETGARCRSGIRCGKIPSNGFMLGWMATPPSGKIFVRAWTKPASGKCTDVKMALFNETTNGTVANGASQTPGPDENGWCRFELVGSHVAFNQPAIFIQSEKTIVLLDDVIAVPTTGAKPNIAGPGLTKAEEARALSALKAARQNWDQPIFPPPMDKPPRSEEVPIGHLPIRP